MKARFAIALLAVAMLCVTAVAQEQNAQYWYEKGLKLEGNQSYEDAVQAYDHAIKLDPQNPEFWEGRALSLYFIHRNQDATESWKKALQLYNDTLRKNPKDVDAWRGKGRAFTMLALADTSGLREAYRESELNAYEQGLRIAPQNSTLLYFKGSALYELKRYDEAITACDQALKIGFDPSQPWMADGASHLKGLAESALGKKNDSVQSYQEALKGSDEAIKKANSPQNLSEAWAEKGMMLEEQGNYNESVKAFDNATNANSKNEMAWKFKGFMLANWMGRYQEGLAALDKALEIRPAADVWEAKARVFNELGKYRDAIAASDKARALNQNLTTAWRGKGFALFGLGKYQAALDAYARDQNTDDETLWTGRGFALANLNRSGESIAAFNKSLNISETALQEDNKSAHAWFWKGEALRGLGRYQKALDAYNRSLEIGPDKAIELNQSYAEAWCTKCKALSNVNLELSAEGLNKTFEDAIRACDKAIAIDPENARFWSGKGFVLSQMAMVTSDRSKYNESLQAYEKAIEAAGKNKTVLAEAWYGKGYTLNLMGNSDEAIKAHEKAIELNQSYAEAWVGKATALSRMERYDEALLAYNRVFEIYTNDEQRVFDYPYLWYSKARALEKLGREEEAAQAYDKSVGDADKIIAMVSSGREFYMNLSEAWQWKGQLLEELGRYGEAIKALDNATNVEPKSISDWNLKGFLLASELGRYNESLQAYDHALRIDPEDAEALVGKGNVLRSLGKYREAGELYDRALEIVPQLPQNNYQLAKAWCGKGEVQRNQGRNYEALKAYDKSIELDPRYSQDARIGRAMVLESIGRHEEAVEAYNQSLADYERITENNPKRSYVWYGKGNALAGLGRYNESLQAYNKAIELNPRYIDAWRNKGYALDNLALTKYGLKDPENFTETLEDAIAAHDKVIAIDHENSEAWLDKGFALGLLGPLNHTKYNESISDYDRAIKLNPKNAEAWLGKGEVLSRMAGSLKVNNSYDEAIKAFDKTIELNPENGNAWWDKGYALKALGRNSEADASFVRAKELGTLTVTVAQNNTSSYWLKKGYELSINGSNEQALQAYEKAIQIDPENAIAWINKANALAWLNKTSESNQAYHKALEITNKTLETDPRNIVQTPTEE
jgi:superkiller protein 3